MLALPIDSDFAILLLISLDILFHCVKQKFEVLRGHNYSRMNSCARNSGSYSREVDDKLSGGGGNDSEIGIDSFRFFFAKFDLELLCVLLLWCLIDVCHNFL